MQPEASSVYGGRESNVGLGVFAPFYPVKTYKNVRVNEGTIPRPFIAHLDFIEFMRELRR